MKELVEIVESRRWVSEVRPEIGTTDASLAETIAWGDAHPRAWEIVLGTRSQAHGRASSDYMGCERGVEPWQVLARLDAFRSRVEGEHPNTFMTWRARFVLEHYGRRGYAGGLFQEHCVWTDGREYPRHCMVLDYTPDTLGTVIDRFVEWCESSYRYDNRTRVARDGIDVRVFERSPVVGAAL